MFGWLPTFWHVNGLLPTPVYVLVEVGQLMGTQDRGQILATQIFGGAILSSNQTYRRSMLCVLMLMKPSIFLNNRIKQEGEKMHEDQAEHCKEEATPVFMLQIPF
jgi:hypothetical protein